MNDKSLSEKEFEIINIIGDGFRLNQRQISHQTGFSLGMTNLLVRRLVTKGYLRIKQLNRKKVEYLLTTRSLSEKLHKTYHYTRKTIESIGLIRDKIRHVVESALTLHIKRIVVTGDGDLADLTHLILQEYIGLRCSITRAARASVTVSPDLLIVDATPDEHPSTAFESCDLYIHLLSVLAQGPQTRRASPIRLAVR